MHRPHPLSDVRGRRVRGVTAAALIVLAHAVSPFASAQAPAREEASGVRPPMSPRRAFFTSLLAPGLAQSQMDRGSGLLFATVEALSLTMYAKASRDLDVARGFSRDSTPARYTVDPSTGDVLRDSLGAPLVAEWATTRYGEGRVRARKTHVEDWIALLIFNHLVAAADAFVAAQLWDLPARVSARAAPRTVQVEARIPW